MFVMGFDDLGTTDEEFAMVNVANKSFESPLKFPTKEPAVKKVDPAIHESIAVRGTNHGVNPKIKDRPFVDRDIREMPAEISPCVSEFRIDRSED